MNGPRSGDGGVPRTRSDGRQSRAPRRVSTNCRVIGIGCARVASSNCATRSEAELRASRAFFAQRVACSGPRVGDQPLQRRVGVAWRGEAAVVPRPCGRAAARCRSSMRHHSKAGEQKSTADETAFL
ncbi:hypothetical protein WG70_25935 [Burkholderia oklahomensis EO147]|nr:hypothetical protein WG70_25935 [Burkholderia oklahomensis EO147]KUY63048.1 hypothetical protein WG70_05090 [Burkholderia oklahomensis EO147]